MDDRSLMPSDAVPPIPSHRAFDARTEPNVLERLRGPLWVIGLTLASVAFVLLSTYAIYNLDQAPHRLVKVLFALLTMTIVLLRPDWVLLVVPFTLPYVEWLPKSPIPFVNALNLLVGSLVLGWLGKTVMQRRTFVEWTPLNVPLLMFLAWVLVTSLIGELVLGDGAGGLGSALRRSWAALTGFVFFFLVYNNLKDRAQVRNLILAMCLAMGLGALGLLRESADYGGGRRVAGGIGDINRAGSYYASMFLFTVEMLTRGYRGFWTRLLLLGAAVGGALGIALPASRGAVIGLAVGLLPQTLRGGLFRILFVGAGVLAFLAFAPDMVTQRFSETVETVQGGSDVRESLDESSGGRLEIWGATLEVIGAYPVFGVGFGRLPEEIDAYLGRNKAGHNLYLETAAEQGVPGLLLLLIVFAVCWRQAQGLLRFGPFERAVGLGFQYYCVALLVSNIFGLRLYDFSNAGTFAILAAIVFRLRNLAEEEEHGSLRARGALSLHPARLGGKQRLAGANAAGTARTGAGEEAS